MKAIMEQTRKQWKTIKLFSINYARDLISTKNSIKDIIKIIPDLEGIYKRYRDLIYYKKVHFTELVFTKRSSKDSKSI